MNEVMYLVIGLEEFLRGLVPCGAYNLRHLFDLKLNAASLHKVLAVSRCLDGEIKRKLEMHSKIKDRKKVFQIVNFVQKFHHSRSSSFSK